MASATRSPQPTPDRPPGRHLRGVAATFWVNGVVFSSLFPRYPQLAEAVGADEAQFGTALAAIGVGGLLGTAVTPSLVRRIGLTRVVTLGGALVIALGVAVPLSGSVLALGVTFGLLGLADGLHDVGMNEIALGEQQRRHSSIMGGLHGVWSVGSAIGTAAGALMAALDVPVLTHMVMVALVAGPAQIVAAGRLRDRPEMDPDATGNSRRANAVSCRRATFLLMLAGTVLGVVAAEQTLIDWSALLLARGLQTSAGVAGAGPVVVAAGILLGRTVTDRAIDTWGGRGVATGSAALVAAAALLGMLAATLVGDPRLVLLALGVAGIGVAPAFPLLFGAGDELARRLGLRPGTGTSVVGTLPRLAGIVLPVGVGVLAGRQGLPTTLLVVAVGAVVMGLGLPRLLPTSDAR